MSIDVLVPEKLGKDIECEIREWLKRDGEYVKEGEVIVILETIKVTFDLEAPSSGVLHIIKPKGAIVKAGEKLATIEHVEKLVKESEKIKEAMVVTPKVVEAKVLASPKAKKLAKEHEIDLSKVRATGPGGMITEKDVLSYLKTMTIPKVEEVETIPLTGWRKVMADKMSQSMRTAAQITTVMEVDATQLIELRERLQPIFERNYGVHLTLTMLIIKAVAKALQEYPIMNSSLVGDKIIVRKYCNIGFAVAREKEGLVVPVVHNVEKKTLVDIAKEVADLTEKARKGELSIDDVKGGTFTITNPGVLGVVMDTPIINPPESAILGVGAIVKRPVAVNEKVVIRPIMYLCLTYDHRVIDGLPAIMFLRRVKEILEKPDIIIE